MSENGDRTDWQLDPHLRTDLTEAEAATTPTKLLTAADLADRWGIPQGQVYRLARDGRLASVRLGRYRRFSLPAIEAFEQKGGTG
jgi:excisionase family DNA binding protein